jgi:hypothetical protein
LIAPPEPDKIRGIKKLLLRLANQPVDHAGTDLAMLLKLGADRAQKRIAILERERLAGSHDRGQVVVRQRKHLAGVTLPPTFIQRLPVPKTLS